MRRGVGGDRKVFARGNPNGGTAVLPALRPEMQRPGPGLGTREPGAVAGRAVGGLGLERGASRTLPGVHVRELEA